MVVKEGVVNESQVNLQKKLVEMARTTSPDAFDPHVVIVKAMEVVETLMPQNEGKEKLDVVKRLLQSSPVQALIPPEKQTVLQEMISRHLIDGFATVVSEVAKHKFNINIPKESIRPTCNLFDSCFSTIAKKK